MTFHSLNISPPYNLFLGPKPSANQSSTNHNRVFITLFIHLFILYFIPPFGTPLLHIHLYGAAIIIPRKLTGTTRRTLFRILIRTRISFFAKRPRWIRAPLSPSFSSLFSFSFYLSFPEWLRASSSRPVAETHVPVYWALFVSLLVSGYNCNPFNHRHLHPSICPNFYGTLSYGSSFPTVNCTTVGLNLIEQMYKKPIAMAARSKT
jgi:hypothetical protein